MTLATSDISLAIGVSTFICAHGMLVRALWSNCEKHLISPSFWGVRFGPEGASTSKIMGRWTHLQTDTDQPHFSQELVSRVCCAHHQITAH